VKIGILLILRQWYKKFIHSQTIRKYREEDKPFTSSKARDHKKKKDDQASPT